MTEGLFQYERRKPFRRFKDISVSERILNTVFLFTIGVGYIAALSQPVLHASGTGR